MAYLDNNGVSKVFSIIKDKFALKNGSYDGLTAGQADQLNSTIYVEDKVPYLFRSSGGSADIGNREYDKIVGGSIVWNQLIKNGNFAGTSEWQLSSMASYSASDSILTFTASAQNGYIQSSELYPMKSSHVYWWTVDVKLTTASTDIVLTSLGYADGKRTEANTNWQNLYHIQKPAVNISGSLLRVTDTRASDWDAVQVRNAMCIDLTMMFGPTVANHIAALEANTPGSGLAWIRRYFAESYYKHNTGQLLSVKLISHDMVMFNQWDEQWEAGDINDSGQNSPSSSQIRSKNYISVIPNASYYERIPNGSGYVFFYDKNKNFISKTASNNTTFIIPSNCWYIRFRSGSNYGSTYKNDICINLSWSGYRNGEYEPYEKKIYALDSSVELRGIAKLDANNDLYYDGDEYASDGTVTRRYGIVDLATLTWNYSYGQYYSTGIANLIKRAPSINTKANIIAEKYNASFDTNYGQLDIYVGTNDGNIYIRDANQSGTPTGYLIYELATSTTETADSFDDPQIVNDFGTEEYVVPLQATDASVPVGHTTNYPANLRDKLQRLPDMPSNDGYYVVKYESRQCAFYDLPTWLSANGYSAIQDLSSSVELATGITATFLKCYKVGNIVTLTFNARNTSGSNVSSGSTIATISSSICPNSVVFRVDIGGSDARAVISHIFHTLTFGADFNNDAVVYVSISYAIA